jgi:Transglycosylase-like domain
MRKRTLLIAAPLCVVVLAAGVAAAAPSGREQVNDARLEKPHAVRPIAASPSVLDDDVLAAVLKPVVAFVQDVQARQIVAFLDDVIAEQAAEAQATVFRQSAPAPSGDNGDFLSCVKQRESHGDYTVHNTQGSGASGAYQFMPGTWNSIAGSAGRSDLVGVDPAAASPEDQDAMAAELYDQRGAAPWGGGC